MKGKEKESSFKSTACHCANDQQLREKGCRNDLQTTTFPCWNFVLCASILNPDSAALSSAEWIYEWRSENIREVFDEKNVESYYYIVYFNNSSLSI